MTLAQYSELQRKLGYLEGMGWALPDDLRADYAWAVEDIDKILKEIMNDEPSQK